MSYLGEFRTSGRGPRGTRYEIRTSISYLRKSLNNNNLGTVVRKYESRTQSFVLHNVPLGSRMRSLVALQVMDGAVAIMRVGVSGE